VKLILRFLFKFNKELMKANILPIIVAISAEFSCILVQVVAQL
jgi:hypothetical protein